ncbi:DMT family transporter [Kordiimonas lacus]|uniref:Threonine/homoserine efflux transporter RhtA n=1 Tax=Kordiimonas lacus TaxID=637679 RepID=A0A1G6YCA5_9PROT|nr:EamA family transporter [Kordiimonas lacus]SDD88009.1 Threonine/homoserine efflux transporter RhtA [Kordiimonas lacus]
MTEPIPQMGPRQWGLLAMLSVLWGASFMAIEVAITALPPLTVVAVRVSLAALGLYCFMKLTGVSVPGAGHKNKWQIWGALAVMGLLNNIMPFSLIAWGQTQIASSLASILNATMPLFTVFVAHFFIHDERLTARRFSGVLVGFLGVVSIIGPGSLAGLTGEFMGQISVLAGSLSYAFAVVAGRRFVGLGLKPVQMAFGQVTMAAVMLIPIVFLVDAPQSLPPPEARVWAALLSLSLLSTALAYLLYFRLISEAGATSASLVTLTIPVVATTFGVLFLDESLQLGHGIGLALIGLGLLVLDGRLLRRLRNSTRRQASSPPL